MGGGATSARLTRDRERTPRLCLSPTPSPTVGLSGPAQQRRWLLLGATVAGHAIKHFFAAGLFIVLPELKAGLDLSNAQVGALSTARNLAGGLANVPAGFVADRWPERRAEILGLSIAGIGVFA